jgi:hypothetical protein
VRRVWPPVGLLRRYRLRIDDTPQGTSTKRSATRSSNSGPRDDSDDRHRANGFAPLVGMAGEGAVFEHSPYGLDLQRSETRQLAQHLERGAERLLDGSGIEIGEGGFNSGHRPKLRSPLLERYEYFPTPKGSELWPVLMHLLLWGDRHYPAPDGPPQIAEHTRRGGRISRNSPATSVDASSHPPRCTGCRGPSASMTVTPLPPSRLHVRLSYSAGQVVDGVGASDEAASVPHR